MNLGSYCTDSSGSYCCMFYYVPADISKTPYCEIQLNDEKLKAFIYAVKNHYWYQMYIDDLPIWGK